MTYGDPAKADNCCKVDLRLVSHRSMHYCLCYHSYTARIIVLLCSLLRLHPLITLLQLELTTCSKCYSAITLLHRTCIALFQTQPAGTIDASDRNACCVKSHEEDRRQFLYRGRYLCVCDIIWVSRACPPFLCDLCAIGACRHGFVFV